MFNVLEERDIQVRGYSLRLPLDLLLVATRQPRGLHQPRPDHHPAQGPVRCRDPHPLPARGRRRGRADQPGGRRSSPTCPSTCSRSSPGSPAGCASRPAVDQRSGVSARFAIAAAEGVAASALRRAARAGEGRGGRAHLRRADGRADAAGQGRVRDGRGGPRGARCCSTCCGSPSPRRSATGWPGSTCPASPSCSPRARSSRPASWCRPPTCSTRSARCRACPRCSTGSATATTPRPGEVAAAVEFVLEGLHLTRRIDKDTVGGRTVYGASRAGRDHVPRPVPLRPLARRSRPARPAVRRPRRARRGRAATCSPAARCARRCATCCAAASTGDRGPRRPRRAGPPDAQRGPAARRPRRHPRPGARRPRPGARRRARHRSPARTTTTPGWPRWSWPPSRTTPRARCGRWPTTTGTRDEARATYESIQQMLQREVLDAQFAGLKQALDDPDPEAMQAVKDMLADLNALLAAHARGEDTDGPVPRVHGQARRPVPGAARRTSTS